MGLQRVYSKTVLRGDETMGCRVLKKLKLMSGKMLKSKAVRERVRRLEAARQAAIASSQRKVEYYEGLGD